MIVVAAASTYTKTESRCACQPRWASGTSDQETASFEPLREASQLRAWLKRCQVTEIAMESTGQYLAALVEPAGRRIQQTGAGEPQHIKGLNGYKTDPKDAQWIADLLESGKLRGSWVPERPIRELRDLTRQRVNLLEDLTRAKNRIEQLCQSWDIKVSLVATDRFGVSGRRMLQALLEGKRDAGWMAD
jgi:transposase